MIDKKKKKQIVEEFKTHNTDTGSASVQIALLTEKIDQLSKHLKTYSKDFCSRRGFLKLIGKRRRLLSYFKKYNKKECSQIIKKLKLER